MKKTASLKEIWKRVSTGLTEALFPSKCSACRNFIHIPRKHGPHSEKEIQIKYSQAARGDADFAQVMAHCLCPDCISKFTPVKSPICTQCGMMFKNRQGRDRVCNRCSMKPNRFGMASVQKTVPLRSSAPLNFCTPLRRLMDSLNP